MPNYVINQLTFDCSDNQFQVIINDITTEDDHNHRFFDFNKLIPMPESLRIAEGSQANDAFRLAIALSNENTDDIQALKEELGDDYENYLELGNVLFRNQRDYGYRSWYDWRCANWGTKWNALDCEFQDVKKQIRFQTAWSAPDPVILALSARYPNVIIEHKYADEDIGWNIGWTRYQNACTNEYFDFSTCTKKQKEVFAIELWDNLDYTEPN